MTLRLCLYFLAGVGGDFLIAKYYLCMSRRSRFSASGLAIVITLFNFYVLGRIVVNENVPLQIAFALGTGIGTLLAFGKRRTKKLVM
jgi:multidrug transporter EmrE-like cation transporter